MKKITKILICILAFCVLLPLMASCNEKKPGGMEYQTPPPEETEQTTPSEGGNGGNNGKYRIDRFLDGRVILDFLDGFHGVFSFCFYFIALLPVQFYIV